MQAAVNDNEAITGPESALRLWGIVYEKKADGTLFVPGDIDISDRKLTTLPNFRGVVVGGDFNCGDNAITTLDGAPDRVEGNFRCNNTNLTILQGGPSYVGGDYDVGLNPYLGSLYGAAQEVGGSFRASAARLVTLEGGPRKVGGNYTCTNSGISRLAGAPEHISGNFICAQNNLGSLEGGPKTVGGKYDASFNPLATLKGSPVSVGRVFNVAYNQLLKNYEGGPASFGRMVTLTGSYNNWDEVPDELRYSPEKLVAVRREQMEQLVAEVTYRAGGVQKATLAPERAAFRKKARAPVAGGS